MGKFLRIDNSGNQLLNSAPTMNPRADRAKLGNALNNLHFRPYQPNKVGPSGIKGDLIDQCFAEGMVCPHGHTIRDESHFWCAKCVEKIASNIIGLDVNLVTEPYRALFKQVLSYLPTDLPIDQCWPVPEAQLYNKRFYMPRPTGHANIKQNQKVTIRKVVYTAFWGDIGVARVTRDSGPGRPCKNPDCCNPFHLVSTFNICPTAPRTFHYLDLNYDAAKLAFMARREAYGMSIDDIHKLRYKAGIRDPKMDADVLMERTYCTHEQPEHLSEGTVAIQSS